jgi:hypothetical protein
MARKYKQNKKTSRALLPVMRPDAARIDIGATEIFVAVPSDRAAENVENVRSFPAFTQDLYALADWLKQCKSALGDFYRRMRAKLKLGAPKAITAAAHKLARIIFHLISTRQEFDDSKFAADQLRHQKRQEIKLRAKAKSMGFELIPLQPAV